jgi:hypothetical protein
VLALHAVITDPALRTLLRHAMQHEPQHRSPFFTALLALARSHDRSPSDYLPDEDIDEGYAVEIRGAQQRYVVAVLRGDSHVIPGSDTQHLVLLSLDGRVLDSVSCEISNRLTRGFGHGTFRTDAPSKPEGDGARLLIRYIPEPGVPFAQNFSHGINHAGRGEVFHWLPETAVVPPAELERRGLCRVAIRNGRFAILFPAIHGPHW